MKTAQSTFATAVKDIAERALQAEDDHSTPQELRDYVERRLPPEVKDRLQVHLALCIPCADALLEMAQSGRSSLLDRMGSLLGRPSVAYGLAVMLLVGFLGVFYQGEHAHLNVHIETLVPAEDRGGGEGGRLATLRVPDGADYVLLLLGLTDTRPFELYRLELGDLSSPGSPLVQSDRVHRMPAGNVSLEIPSETLRPGDYRISLSGAAGNGWELLAAYRFRVEREGGGRRE